MSCRFIWWLPHRYDGNTAGRPSFPQKQPLKRFAAFPVPQMSEQAPTYRRTQKSHPGGTVETGSEQKRDAHPQVAGHNGTLGGCLLFPAGVVCGKKQHKGDPGRRGTAGDHIADQKPRAARQPNSSQSRPDFFRTQQKEEPCKRDKPQVFLLSRISFQPV